MRRPMCRRTRVCAAGNISERQLRRAMRDADWPEVETADVATASTLPRQRRHPFRFPDPDAVRALYGGGLARRPNISSSTCWRRRRLFYEIFSTPTCPADWPDPCASTLPLPAV